MEKTAFDYSAWLERAVDFTRRIAKTQSNAQIEISVAAPLGDAELKELSERLARPIPPSIQRFLTRTTSSCICRWVCEPSPDLHPFARAAFPDECIISPPFEPWEGPWHCIGGPGFFNGDDLADSTLAWESLQEVYPNIAEKLARCLVISDILNGDALALDLQCNADDPPVIYLDHEVGEAYHLAESFDDFLLRWEGLCYIGPEGWMLYPFYDESIGGLNIDGPAAMNLRKLFSETLKA